MTTPATDTTISIAYLIDPDCNTLHLDYDEDYDEVIAAWQDRIEQIAERDGVRLEWVAASDVQTWRQLRPTQTGIVPEVDGWGESSGDADADAWWTAAFEESWSGS